MPASTTTKSPGAIRARGVLGTLLSALAAAAWIWVILRGKAEGVMWRGPWVALPLVPLVYFLTELILGRSDPDLSRRWDSLAGWQRGVIGTLIVLGVFSITMAIALVTVLLPERN
jgi:hypothetical protein